MRQQRARRHEAPISVTQAERKYGIKRHWLYYRRHLLSPVPVEALGLKRNTTWYYEDEVRQLVKIAEQARQFVYESLSVPAL